MSQAMLDDVHKMLDAYIYDYLLKRKLYASARSFLAEGKVFMNPVAFDEPRGFLLEWWSVFWDLFIARINPDHSEAAASYIKSQMMKNGNLQLQQQYFLQKTQQSTTPTANRLVSNNSLNIQNSSVANKIAAKMYENYTLPIQRDTLANVLPKKRFLKHVSHPPASIFGAAAMNAQLLSQSQTPGNSSTSIDTQYRSQQLPGSKKLKGEMKSTMNSRVSTAEGIAGSNQGTSHLPFNGGPSTGLNPLSLGQLQQPKSFIQLLHTSNRSQLEHPFMFQAAQSLGVPSANAAFIRPVVPLSQNLNTGKDSQLCSIDVSDVDSMASVCHPALAHHPVLSQHSQNSNHIIQQQDKLADSGITNVDGYTSNNFQADMDGLMDDGALDDVESFLSPKESDERYNVGLLSDSTKGLTLKEIRVIPANTRKVECCCFSSDGKLFASGGSDKKATVWCTKSFKVRSTLDEHSQWITEVCFSPRTLKVATSSADRTVKVWDVDNHGQSLRTFTGHSTGVTSLDFHPSKDDLICSSDISSEIRYWSIKNGSCVGIFKGGATKLRFQPNNGRMLAAAVGNVVSIIDVETQVCIKLQGHKSQIHSVCWDPSGEYLASTSDDVAKVWKFGSGSKGDCIRELNCNGNTFHTCVFHPTNTSVLIIGSHESLELWDMTKNKTRTLHAHEKLVSALAASNVTGLVASASHDNCVKLWQ
ncbi:transcriptional corepressor LEUNIG_HOMOLOG-like isoform X3 [Benincasa hispida]|uniref:transcriptional corepressor LEUNIG_HOMOLOG-like isoform X3 n=1 Tax=Benincasa hispida TaxID=102211 RepID=UPI00190007A3|nr:transcriptional corepressor LEUNIG_HOMOLOG-like isoform X3 [Benincasa hispida]